MRAQAPLKIYKHNPGEACPKLRNTALKEIILIHIMFIDFTSDPNLI